MCARVTLTIDDIDEIAGMLDAELSPEDARRYKRRYNVAPSDTHWMLEYGADRRVLVPAKWGYVPTSPPGRARKPLINVRGEQVGSGHGFREAFASRRCAVVTDGFFEWNQRREPFWYHRPDGGLVLLAGLFQGAADAEREPRFTVLTTRPNKLIAADPRSHAGDRPRGAHRRLADRAARRGGGADRPRARGHADRDAGLAAREQGRQRRRRLPRPTRSRRPGQPVLVASFAARRS